MEPTRDAVVQVHWRLQVIYIIIINMAPCSVRAAASGTEQAHGGGGGGGGGGLKTLFLWGILVSLKMISQDSQLPIVLIQKVSPSCTACMSL